MNTKRKISFGVVLSTLLIVLAFSISINAVYAFFSASAKKDISFKYATLTIDVTEETASTGKFAKTTSGTFTSLIPGDVIKFSDVTVANAGTADCYVLVNLVVDLVQINPTTKAETILKTYNEWYNLSGTKNTADTTAGSTYLAKSGATGASSKFNLNWTLPGEDIDNDYQGVTVNAKITVYAIQAYLPDNTTTNDAVYATEFILANHANFNEN